MSLEKKGAEAKKKPNVVFVLVDAFRNDHFLGQSSAKTPFFERLRKESTVFSQAISVASASATCYASLFTGLYSFRHGIRMQIPKETRGLKTLAMAFKEAGYNTYSEMTDPVLETECFKKGFDEMHCRNRDREHVSNEWGQKIVRDFKNKRFKEPYFLLLHIWLVHRPRFMSDEFNKPEYGKVAYQRSTSCLDFYLKKVFEAFGPETVVILTADHGEIIPKNKFQEYWNNMLFAGYFFMRKLNLTAGYPRSESHGFDVSEDVIRVPLAFRGPMFPKGLEIGQQVSQVDIPVTVANALNLGFEKKADGQNLMPLIRGREQEERPVFIEACSIKIDPEKEWVEGLRTSKWKYLRGTFNRALPERLYSLKEGKETRVCGRSGVSKKLGETLDKMKGESK